MNGQTSPWHGDPGGGLRGDPRGDVCFDRLVDGELTPEEYRALLAALDDEPNGWRRCALAFLEAQAMGQEFGSIRRSGQLQNDSATPEPVLRKSASRTRGWKLLPAMAASFLVAFALGVTAPGWLRQSNSPRSPISGPHPDLATNAPVRDSQRLPQHVGQVRLVVDGPGGSRTEAAEVPIYEVGGNAARWIGAQEPALPAELIAELERRGHQVQRQQQYVPVDWEDGRQGVIPVESYRITPVRHTY